MSDVLPQVGARRVAGAGAWLLALATLGSAWADDGSPALPPAAPAASAPTWSLRLPAKSGVVFRGVVNFDGAGTGTMNMVYPAPNPAGLLAGILTHALIADSAKTRQKEQIQSSADAVLAPYRQGLEGYTSRDLYSRALRRVTAAGPAELVDVMQPASTNRLVDLTPIFFLAQDQRAVVVESVVLLSLPGTSASNAREFIVRVVSDAWAPERPEEDAAAHWGDNDAARLKEASASLLAQALDIALAAASATAPAEERPFRTFRYAEGSNERMERGQLVHELCGRLVIRTLRGALMSVPVPPGAEPSRCESAKSRD